MAKFYGSIGYADSVETTPGVHEEKITEYHYYIDVGRNTRRLQSSDQLNDDINVSNEFSILSDPFAEKYFHKMRYVTFGGPKWKITSVEVRYPRLILNVGGLYNG